MFQYQNLKFTNFAGGITDKYIDAPPNACQTCINMDITKFGTLETRRGFKWYLEANITSYATTPAWSRLGILRRPSAIDAIIIAQYDDFYILNDEVEVTFDAKDITNGSCTGGLSLGDEENKVACELVGGTWGFGQYITFGSDHNLANGDEVYLKNITDSDVGLTKDTKYYFKKLSATTGSLHTSTTINNTDIVDFSKSAYSKTFTLTKKATASAILPPDGTGNILKADTMTGNQPVCFTEWQGQLLTASKGNSGIDISRPARIYYGTTPLVFITNDNDTGANTYDTAVDVVIGDVDVSDKDITVPDHDLVDNDTVIYREISVSDVLKYTDSGSKTFTDGTTYYVDNVGSGKVTLHTATPVGSGNIVTLEAVAGGFGTAALIPTSGASVAWRSHTLGLPKPGLTAAGAFSTANFNSYLTNGSTDSADSGSLSYLYKCVFKYIYKANDIEYTTYGPPSDALVHAATNAVDSTNFKVIKVPTLETPTGGIYIGAEWDLERIMIEVYRTINNGSTYYYVNEVRNDPDETTLKTVDVVTDANLVNRKALYTTGGMVDLWPAPKARYVISARDIAYYCNTVEEYLDTEGTNKSFKQKARPNRIYQSVPGIAGSIGDTFYVDVDEEIIGAGEINGLPIIFTSTFIYRLEGTINSTGAGAFRTRVIDKTVGCLSHASIVSTPRGIFFAGNDGFYQTDGYRVSKLTELLEDSYASITETPTAKELINGTYEPKEEKIYWGVAKTGSTIPDEVWVLNLQSNGFVKMDALNFEATSLVARDGDLFRGDVLGFVHRHSKDYRHDYIRSYDDPTIEVVVGLIQPVHEWDKRYIDFRYVSGATSFGNPGYRKWVNDVTLSLESDGNMGVKPISINDADNIPSDLKEIIREDTWVWQDDDFAWGDSTLAKNVCKHDTTDSLITKDSSGKTITTATECTSAGGTMTVADTSVSTFRWSGSDIVTKPRRFPRKNARCRRKQVGLVPASYKRYFSGTWGIITVGYSASQDSLGVYTATLKYPAGHASAGSVKDWPENLDGGSIHIPTTPRGCIEDEATHTTISICKAAHNGKWSTTPQYDSTSSDYSAFKIVDKPTASTITFRGIIENISGADLSWYITNYVLKQRVEIKEISIGFGVIGNIEGRFQTEEEVSG